MGKVGRGGMRGLWGWWGWRDGDMLLWGHGDKGREE